MTPPRGDADDRLRAVLDTVPEAYAVFSPVLDADGRYVDARLGVTNLAWRRQFLGRDADDPGEVEGRSVYAVVPGLRARIELHRHTWATGEPFRGIVLLNVPGGPRWAELNLARAGDELVACTRDVTDQRETDIALDESREMLRSAMDAVIEAYAIFRGVTDDESRYADASVVYANETWRRLFSPDDPDVEGRSLATFPSERDRFALLAQVYETGDPYRGFVDLRTGDETRVLDLQLVRFGRYIVSSSRDITDQRRAEAALHASERRHREVVEGIDAIVWDHDLVTGDSFMSQRVEAITGYEAERFAAFELWSSVLHPDDRERVIAAVTGTDDSDIEYRLQVAGGAWRWFRDRTHVVRDGDGTPIRRYGISIDVTERRELEERVRRSERFSSVGQLAANVSHDFDNVLYGISMFADHLLRTHPEADDPVHEDADAIVRAVRSASGLTASLLSFARAQPTPGGRVVVDDVVGRVEPMLGAVVGSAIPVRLQLHAPAQAVVGEASALEQAVLNLGINARDAMPAGGTLTITTRVVTLDDEEAEELETEPGRGVLLDVVDTGTGMDDETRSRAFEPYFTTKPVGQGTGLGLATVFGTVRASGGGIGIISAPGHGTTIRIFLPAAPAR